MTTRSYKSELREAQAEATRQRILDALVEVLADGVETFSIPAVAERAGVSVGTVYRHFGNKSRLLTGLMAHATSRTGAVLDKAPETLQELEATVGRLFEHFDQVDDLLKAAFASRLGREARLEWTQSRLEAIREAIATIEPGLNDPDVERITQTALILTTSDVHREMRERLDLSSEESADLVAWIVRTLLRGTRP